MEALEALGFCGRGGELGRHWSERPRTPPCAYEDASWVGWERFLDVYYSSTIPREPWVSLGRPGRPPPSSMNPDSNLRSSCNGKTPDQPGIPELAKQMFQYQRLQGINCLSLARIAREHRTNQELSFKINNAQYIKKLAICATMSLGHSKRRIYGRANYFRQGY